MRSLPAEPTGHATERSAADPSHISVRATGNRCASFRSHKEPSRDPCKNHQQRSGGIGRAALSPLRVADRHACRGRDSVSRSEESHLARPYSAGTNGWAPSPCSRRALRIRRRRTPAGADTVLTHSLRNRCRGICVCSSVCRHHDSGSERFLGLEHADRSDFVFRRRLTGPLPGRLPVAVMLQERAVLGPLQGCDGRVDDRNAETVLRSPGGSRLPAYNPGSATPRSPPPPPCVRPRASSRSVRA